MTPSTLPTSFQSRQSVLPNNEERRAFGKQHMSAAMIFWLSQNGWSHPNMEVLANWALKEVGALHTSQMSHIRNGRMRMLGVKTIDALGAINQALWAFHNNKKQLKTLNVDVTTKDVEELLKDAKPLLHPITNEPLDAGDFMNLYLGYIRLEGVVGGASATADFSGVASKLGGYLEEAIRSSGTDFVDAKKIFSRAFQGSPEKANKMVAAAASLDAYSKEELTVDFAQICEALERLDGKTRTPLSVVEELSTQR